MIVVVWSGGNETDSQNRSPRDTGMVYYWVVNIQAAEIYPTTVNCSSSKLGCVVVKFHGYVSLQYIMKNIS